MLKSSFLVILLGFVVGPTLSACIPSGGVVPGGSSVSNGGGAEQQSLYQRLNERGYRRRSNDED